MQVGTDLKSDLVLSGEVGTIIRSGDLIFVRVDNEESESKNDISPNASKKDFDITLSGTEKSQAFSLSGELLYVKVWIKNTSSAGLQFTMTRDSPTGSLVKGSDVTVPANSTWNVYSENPLSARTYYANYTSGKVGLSGQSSCRIASTFKELDL